MAQDGSQADGWTAVMQAVADAALVVTEIMPTPPYTTWKKVRCRRDLVDLSNPLVP